MLSFRKSMIRVATICGRRRLSALLATAVLGSTTLALVAQTPASAATSGWIAGASNAGVFYCNEATINTSRDADGYIQSNSGGSCSSPVNSPAGYLDVQTIEFFNGSECGVAGPAVNDSTASLFGLGGALCGDQGYGNYSAEAANAYWNASYQAYLDAGSATSPYQTDNVVSGGVASVQTTPSGETEGPIPVSDFNGGPLNASSLPDYISVESGGEIVGYVTRGSVAPAVGQAVPGPGSSVPVMNAALTAIVGHMVPGKGFVPITGTGLPATESNGNSVTVTTTQSGS